MFRWSALLLVFSSLSLVQGSADAQDLPDKIRGYTVIKRPETVSFSSGSPERRRVAVELDQLTVHDISVLGLTLHLPVKFISLQQTAKVDFLAFHDVQINGVPISVEEYGHRLVFKKGTGTTLPQPIKVFVPTIRILQIAKRELKGDTNQWRVTGRIFVFGKFRRFGMLHKRAVPVDLDLLFDNPLRQ